MHREIWELQSLLGTLSSHGAKAGVSLVHRSRRKESSGVEALLANLYRNPHAGSQEQLPSSKMQPAMKQRVLQYLHPSQGRVMPDFISQRRPSASSPPPLQTVLQLQSLLWRLEILPLPQQAALPSPTLRPQPA